MKELWWAPVCRSCRTDIEPLSAEFFCVTCKTPFQNRFPLDEHGRCGLCRAGLRGFDAAYCFGAYEGSLRKLIHLFKYSRMRPLAGPLADLMMAAFPRDQRFDAIVPVPLHWRRRWTRGYNQSELLARSISRRTGLPVAGYLRRRRPTLVQAGLTNARRRSNVDGAFEALRGAADKRVLLIDDVMTTGATGAACARALKRAGARSVTLLTVARVDRRVLSQGVAT